MKTCNNCKHRFEPKYEDQCLQCSRNPNYYDKWEKGKKQTQIPKTCIDWKGEE